MNLSCLLALRAEALAIARELGPLEGVKAWDLYLHLAGQ